VSSPCISNAFALAARQHGAVARRQLDAIGLTREAVRHLVRQGALTRVDRDVFVVAATPSTFPRRVWCALLAAGAEAVASHRLAARLHRMRGFAKEGIDVLVHERFHHHAPQGALHTTSWLPAEHLGVVDGIPATTFARTLFDLAGLSSPKRLRAGRPFVHEQRVARALDTAMGNGMPITDVAKVLATMGKRGRPGTVLMRELVEARSGGYQPTESELEDLVIAVLSAYELPLPARQRHLGGEELIGRVDFTYMRPRLVIEADGRPYHTALLDQDSDRWRDTELVAAGWPVIRVRWRDLTQDPERFARAVARALGVPLASPARAGATPPNHVRKRGL
jgi:hypothetical protein